MTARMETATTATASLIAAAAASPNPRIARILVIPRTLVATATNTAATATLRAATAAPRAVSTNFSPENQIYNTLSYYMLLWLLDYYVNVIEYQH